MLKLTDYLYVLNIVQRLHFKSMKEGASIIVIITIIIINIII